ncbi:MAG: DUF255 domain-containing protein [Planctomycetota bacterium]|nr:DUF255 domain-containing protein [Planctomycetota bacterium]MDA0917603.1 DUF255 domain-containing protein [Planctomycetota bacterium]
MELSQLSLIASARPSSICVVVLAVALLAGCGRTEPPAAGNPTGESGAELGHPVSPATFDIFGDEQPAAEVVAVSAEVPDNEKTERVNRLAHETSPYLLMHARNPVDWYPWGPEAFEASKTSGKPVFLSIGYSSCYWCHVMERLVFENEEIAKYMNEHFVNVKVDREERPDIDDIYMTALQIYNQLSGSGGGGGWPLSMFLTPDGKPIAGGTYFPPEDIDGRTGFLTLCRRMIDAWTSQRESIEQGADTITQYLQKEMAPGFSLEKVELTRELAEAVSRSVVQSHDPEFGGVDFRIESPDSPKFPVPTKLALLQYEVEHNDNAAAERVLYHTLDAMAAGGIRDHLAGGFHRYSTDRQWLVPHFEKMLYDNAQLANVYIDAAKAVRDDSKKAEYRRVAEEILSFILSDMTDPTGAFHSAIDAETDGIEGKYYVWSREEVQQALGEQTLFFARTYGMTLETPFEHGYVLHLPRSIEEVAADEMVSPRILRMKLEESRERLLKVRSLREPPIKDDKILTSWNGLMIKAFVNAGATFSQQKYLTAADRALMFILSNMRDSDGHLLRTWRVGTAKLPAYLDDYAFLVEAMLKMHFVSRDEKWLRAARRLTDDQIRLFYDEAAGGFFFTAHDHEKLLSRTKNAWDSVLPSGNSVSVRNLIRLASLTGDSSYRDHAASTLKLFAPQMKSNPRGASNLALALNEFLENRDYRSLTDQVRDSQTVPQNPPTGNSPLNPAANPDAAPTGPAPRELPSAPVNPDASSTPPVVNGNDPKAADPKKTPDRVTATAFLSTSRLPAGDRCRIAVILEVEPGWHINTNPAYPDFLIPTTVSIRSDQGTTLESLKFPQGKDLKIEGLPEAYKVYDGKVTIFGELVVPKSAAGKQEAFELHIRYQSCDDEHCERPRTLKFAGSVPVAEIGEPVQQINRAVFKDSPTAE